MGRNIPLHQCNLHYTLKEWMWSMFYSFYFHGIIFIQYRTSWFYHLTVFHFNCIEFHLMSEIACISAFKFRKGFLNVIKFMLSKYQIDNSNLIMRYLIPSSFQVCSHFEGLARGVPRHGDNFMKS